MKKHLALLALAACAHTGAWTDVTYTYTGDPYTAPTLHNHTGPGCPAGNCGDFTTAMGQSGWFTTAKPLPANLSNGDISGLITGFSFSDGLTTYSSAAGDTLYSASADTTANGTFTDARLALTHWQTPAPHGVGDHLDQMVLHQGVFHNLGCTQIQAGSNQCNAASIGAWGSFIDGQPHTAGTWAITGLPVAAPSPQSVPVDSPLALALALAALGVLGAALRGQRQMLLKR